VRHNHNTKKIIKDNFVGNGDFSTFAFPKLKKIKEYVNAYYTTISKKRENKTDD
jgi:hypothetical protein